jgi:hypothetical protein
MPSLENNCESVIIAILGASADLANFEKLHQDEDDAPSASQKDRIVVSASPREVELAGKEPGEVKAWRVLCKVELFYVTRSESAYDAAITAIEAAMNAATPPPAALSLVSNFTNGATIEQAGEAGERETGDNTRNRSRTFRFIVIV